MPTGELASTRASSPPDRSDAEGKTRSGARGGTPLLWPADGLLKYSCGPDRKR